MRRVRLYLIFRAFLLLLIMGLFLKLGGFRSVIFSGKKFLFDPKEYIKTHEKIILEDPYQEMVADVRFGNELHPAEQEYLMSRQRKATAALEKVLAIPIEKSHLPKISVVCSGGGYRAALGTIGALLGLEKIGLLDAVSYLSVLSGSSWAVALWLSTKMTLNQLKKFISKRVSTNFYRMNKSEAQRIARILAVKIVFGQPITMVDLFGAFVEKHLFGSYVNGINPLIRLSDQAHLLHNGDVPFPIYTAVDGSRSTIKNAAWYEFTPFEIGSADHGMYVPTWACGRRFDRGKSIDFAPEQSLGFYYGVFGSAFGAHIGLVWESLTRELRSSLIASVVEKTLAKTGAAGIRLFYAKLHNFMFGIEGTDGAVSGGTKYLKLVDAGIDYKLPYIPISGKRPQRSSDIIIVFDFSRRIPDALIACEQYARAHNLKFPSIIDDGIDTRAISIFKDEQDLSVPVVIYMPRVSDKQLFKKKESEKYYKKYSKIYDFDFDQCTRSGFCKTVNFRYKPHQSHQVMDQMEFNVIAHEQEILDAISWVIEKKSPKNVKISE